MGEFQPARSPDGEWLAHVTWTSEGGYVWRVKADGTGAADQADVVIENNRISQIGKTGTLRIADGASIRDLRGKTIVPGLIDTHDHWTDMQRDVL